VRTIQTTSRPPSLPAAAGAAACSEPPPAGAAAGQATNTSEAITSVARMYHRFCFTIVLNSPFCLIEKNMIYDF
jgi:hypothetical protein